MGVEQAKLLLAKARDDEILIEEIISKERIRDEIIGFHAQQAAEKLLKSLLMARNIPYRKTHDLRELIDLIRDHDIKFPEPRRSCTWQFEGYYRTTDKMPQYLIEFRFQGYARKYLKRSIFDVARRFHVEGVTRRRPVPHITLAGPFERTNHDRGGLEMWLRTSAVVDSSNRS